MKAVLTFQNEGVAKLRALSADGMKLLTWWVSPLVVSSGTL